MFLLFEFDIFRRYLAAFPLSRSTSLKRFGGYYIDSEISQTFPQRVAFPISPLSASRVWAQKGEKKEIKKDSFVRCQKPKWSAPQGKAMRRRQRWFWQPSLLWWCLFSVVVARTKQKSRTNNGSHKHSGRKREKELESEE